MARDASELVRFETTGGVLVAEILVSSVGGVDGPAIGDAILDAVQASGGTVRAVAVDMSRVASINSMMLGALVTAKTSLLKLGLPIGLLGPTRGVRELLEITQLTKVFTVLETRNELGSLVD